jgi:hypothetical protein
MRRNRRKISCALVAAWLLFCVTAAHAQEPAPPVPSQPAPSQPAPQPAPQPTQPNASPPAATAPASAEPAPDEEPPPTNTPTRMSVPRMDPLTAAENVRLRALEKELARRRTEAIQRQELIKDAVTFLTFQRTIARLPVGSEQPIAAAMPLLRKRSKEVQKRIPRLIRFLGGKKAKTPKNKKAAAPKAPTDMIIDILGVLRRINPSLDAMARNQNIVDVGRSERLIADLQVVQALLQEFQ